MNTALLFPGQGSQRVGMGRDLAQAHEVARRTYEEADDVLGWKLSALCFDGPEDELTLTKHTQPAILTTSIAVFRVLAEGRDPKTTRLSDVMTAQPQTITPEKPFGHALLMMYESGFRHVPVVEDGKPVGMVSARDVLGPELQEFESELQRRTRIGEILG